MKLLAAIRAKQGYTLLESIVAMALFTSVLLSVVALIAQFTFHNTDTQSSAALSAAESEFARILTERDFTNGGVLVYEPFVVKREVVSRFPLVDITVRVALRKKVENTLVTLNKTVLAYQ